MVGFLFIELNQCYCKVFILAVINMIIDNIYNKKGDFSMKKSNIIKMFSILTMAAAGAFAVGAGLSSKKAEKADALNSGDMIYINLASNLGDAYVY